MTTDDLRTLTIYEITALLPKTADWRIIDSKHAHVRTSTGTEGRIYWDDQDPENEGWAYQIAGTDERPEESGELNTARDVADVFAV